MNNLTNYEKIFYDKWPCRKMMITKIFPMMNGSVLNVGVHNFNKNDFKFFKDSVIYHTIDLMEKNKIYGSQIKHITGDILNLDESYTYDNIILFGVLNIKNHIIDTNKHSSEYTLYNNEDKLINKINTLLNKNGIVLFGPDIPQSKKENSKIVENNFDKIILDNTIIKSNFILLNKFIGKGNIIYLLKKIK